MSSRIVVLLLAVLISTGVVSARQSAFADEPAYQELYQFCHDPQTCRDGDFPNAVTADAQGNLYGTTEVGGDNSNGTVFSLTHDVGRKHWSHQVIYYFCKKNGCRDGRSPNGWAIVDTAGNLYGTTYSGGNVHGGGVVFELTPNADKSKWTEKILYEFCKLDACKDGEGPEAGLSYPGASSGALYDGVSPLYGTTSIGGLGGQYPEGAGVVYELDPPASGEKKWKEKQLYRFCPSGTCDDGQFPSPYGQLAFDANGNIYGATRYGGHGSSAGVVFELSQSNGKWRQTTLHGFCAEDNCTDGSQPYGNPTFGNAGVLYGTTSAGGGTGYGALFEITPNGDQSQFSVLYNFCSLDNCADGAIPYSSLLVDAQGNLFGTTYDGGVNDSYYSGTLFEYSQSLQVIHNFCQRPEHSCDDGVNPHGPLAESQGVLFGVDGPGYIGTPPGGSVFEFNLGLQPRH